MSTKAPANAHEHGTTSSSSMHATTVRSAHATHRRYTDVAHHLVEHLLDLIWLSLHGLRRIRISWHEMRIRRCGDGEGVSWAMPVSYECATVGLLLLSLSCFLTLLWRAWCPRFALPFRSWCCLTLLRSLLPLLLTTQKTLQGRPKQTKQSSS